MIYELRIVERGGKENEIIDFVVDYHFRKLERVKMKIDKLLKEGYTYNQLDLVMFADKDLDTYLGTLDPITLKDTGH